MLVDLQGQPVHVIIDQRPPRGVPFFYAFCSKVQWCGWSMYFLLLSYR